MSSCRRWTQIVIPNASGAHLVCAAQICAPIANTFFVVGGFLLFQTGLTTRCAPCTREALCDVGPYVLLLRGVRSDAVLHPPNVTRNTPVLSRMPWAGGGKLLMDDW